MKYWEIIADNLKKRGWSLGYVSAIDSQGRRIFVVDAHRSDRKRFVVLVPEMPSLFHPRAVSVSKVGLDSQRH